MSSIKKDTVRVICRFRPMNELEKTNGNEEVATFTTETSLKFKSTRENNTYNYTFDRIFPPESTQEEVYNEGVKGIIDNVLEGYNGTVIAYGQTGSGKTYTMQGYMNQDRESDMGIIPRMINHVFKFMNASPPEVEFTVKSSMVEIYQEKIRDLINLNKVNLNVREDKKKGIFIEDMTEQYCGCPEDVINVMNIGTENRAVGSTNMNQHSSRSHSIFIMTIDSNNKKENISKTGKLYLVDLAGSEKISKTGASGTTLEEAKLINKSLSTLGMVIKAKVEGSAHIPYRDSKLTRVLQESLGGNSKTCMIITCSPSIYNEAETLSTLRFGERAKKMENKAKINKVFTVAELQKIIEKLEDKLARANRRIKQLENYIIEKGLEVPPGDGGLSDDNVRKKKNGEEGEDDKKKNGLKDIDEQKLLEQYREKMDQQANSLNDKIINTLNTLKETEEGYEDLEDMYGRLLVIKENALKKDEEDKKQINQLKDDLNNMTELKNKLQAQLMERFSKEDENQDEVEESSTQYNTNYNEINENIKENINIDMNNMRNNCIELINNLKNDQSIKKNKSTLKIISDFQEQFNIEIDKNTSDIEKNIISTNSTSNVSSTSKKINIKETNTKEISENVKKNINIEMNNLKNNCIELIGILKKDENIKKNKNTLKVLSNFQEKFNMEITKNTTNIEKNIESTNISSSVRTTSKKINIKDIDIDMQFLNKKETVEDEAQTDDNKIEIERVKFECENSKKIFLKTLDDKSEIIFKLQNDIEDYKEKYDFMKSNIALDNKKSMEKILRYEKNLSELKNMLQDSQGQRILLETQNKKILEILKEKMLLISKLVKENNDSKNNLMRSSIVVNTNIVKRIQGGHKDNNL